MIQFFFFFLQYDGYSDTLHLLPFHHNCKLHMSQKKKVCQHPFFFLNHFYSCTIGCQVNKRTTTVQYLYVLHYSSNLLVICMIADWQLDTVPYCHTKYCKFCIHFCGLTFLAILTVKTVSNPLWEANRVLAVNSYLTLSCIDLSFKCL